MRTRLRESCLITLFAAEIMEAFMLNICRLKLIILAIIMSFTLFSAIGRANANSQGLTTHEYPNGFKVLILENPRQDVTTIQYWVEVGGADEPADVRGISHVIEHMAYKGTKKRQVGEISKEIEAIGGRSNAYTSWDKTVFHLTVPTDKFYEGLDILSDAVLNPSIDPKELEKEKEVVIEEILEGEERPGRKSFYQLFDSAYTKSPYKYKVIGTRETVGGITREKIIDFRQKFYTPENMFLVIVGNVKSEEVLKKVAPIVGKLPKSEYVRPPRESEPEQKRIRSSLVKDENSRETRLKIGFHIPSASSVDLSPIDLTADLLGSRDSSRLVKALKKEKRLVNSISVFAITPKDPGLFVISATLDKDKIQPALKEIMDQIKILSDAPPSTDELERAKTHIESDLLYARETVQGAASSIGDFMILLGSANYQEKYLMMNRSVTPEQISGVAKKYLKPSNMTISILSPKDDGTEINLSNLVELAKTYEQKPESRMSLDLDKTVIKTELKNGIRVILKPDPSNSIVSFRVALLGGKRYETPDTKGAMHFVSQMLEKGAGEMSEQDIAKTVENLGGRLSAFSEYDTFGLSATFFSRNIEAGLDLLSTIYSDPTFPQDKVERERLLILNKIRTSPDRPARFTIQKLNATLYPNHPYGYPIEGEMDTVSKLSREELLSIYERYAVPKNTVITAVGAFDPEKTLEIIDGYFGRIPSKEFVKPNIPGEKKIEAPLEKTVRIPRAKSHIAFGFRGTTVKEEDKYALTVLNKILSGMGGRLFIELRDKRSLAYTVASFFRPGVDPGAFVIYMACDPSKTNDAIKGIMEQIELIRKTPVKKEELESAKISLIGNRDISSQSSWSKAERNARYELFGLGLNYDEEFRRKILKVTSEDVLKAAQKYLDPERSAMAKVLPEEI